MATPITPAALDTGFRRPIRWTQDYFKEGRWVRGVGAAAVTVPALILKTTASVGRLFTDKAYNVFDRDLNAVKAHIGVPDSNLNFTQIKKVYDLANLRFRSADDRVKNLDAVCTQTEYSLSKNAHETSKKRGTEDRFFAFEGHKLARPSEAPVASEFLQAKVELEQAIDRQIRVEHKYTLQQGNSASSISRRAYILQSILNFAYERGLAGSFLKALISEAAQIGQGAVDMPFLRTGIAVGAAQGLLSSADPKLYQGLAVSAAEAALKQPKGKNRDEIIDSIFRLFVDTGLLTSDQQAKFTSDVREIITAVETGLIGSPSELLGTEAFVGKEAGKAVPSGKGSASKASGNEEGFFSRWSRKRQAEKEEALRLEAVSQATGDVELSDYMKNLQALIEAQKVLIGQVTELNTLLKTVAENPLNNLDQLSKGDLIGLIELFHNGVQDPHKTLLQQLDANIRMRQDAIPKQQAVVAELARQCKERPVHFKQASEEQRKLAKALETVVKKNRSAIESLDDIAEKFVKKINKVRTTVQQLADKQREKLFPQQEGEEDLPLVGPKPPEAPKQSSFFDRFKSKKEAPKAAVEGQEEEDDAVQFPPLPPEAPVVPAAPKKGWFW
ncbi:MAG: hypothetical protein HY861_05185 [Chlamydiia bacterium]|nr:hypothetical protein [Chlamydiia bacterium]